MHEPDIMIQYYSVVVTIFAEQTSALLFQCSIHCKFQSMKATQNYHNSHTKFKFGMIIVVILCGLRTLEFAV